MQNAGTKRAWEGYRVRSKALGALAEPSWRLGWLGGHTSSHRGGSAGWSASGFVLSAQADELISGQGQDPEHQMSHDLQGAAYADRTATELVLEASVAALGRGALVVAALAGWLHLRPGVVAPGVGVDDRDVPKPHAVLADLLGVVGSVHEVVQVDHP